MNETLVFFLASWPIVLGLGIFAFRWYAHRFLYRHGKTFKMVTLLVTLPKFRREDETKEELTTQRVQEDIGVDETFFSAIAGLHPQSGVTAWLLGRNDHFAFEIVSHEKLIKFYVTIPRRYQEFISQQMTAQHPDAFIEEVEDYNIFSPTGVILGGYLQQKRQAFFPFRTFRKLEADPLNGLTNALSKIPSESGVAIQYIVRPAHRSWRKVGAIVGRNMLKGMTLDEAIRGKKRGEGWMKAFQSKNSETMKQEKSGSYYMTQTEQDMTKGIEEKISKGGLEVNIRLAVSAAGVEASYELLKDAMAAFSQFNIYEYGNALEKFIPLRKRHLIRKFIYRGFDETRRVILNVEEMASLWHLPLKTTETPNILWLNARTAPVPTNIPQEGLMLGYNIYRGRKTDIHIKRNDRQRHMYLVGKSGSGKTVFIQMMALQDIKNGEGVCVLDPHGDMIEWILGNIPKNRIDDVIVFDPSDLERPVGLNMLEVKDETMKDMAVQEMIAIFYKLFPPEMIGPMFEHYMRNVMLTLMADPVTQGTITEIPRMFSDSEYQKQWVSKVNDPVVRSFWENEMAKTSDFHKSEMLGYLISKVGRFVENSMMRNIIGQQQSGFDVREVMDKGKILLVNLAKGRTGEVNASLLGMIIVSKLQMAALARADMPEESRKDFYLYIDEFQNFITDSISTILSEARKYRLNLIVGHQYMGQLVKDNKTEIRDAVLGNVGSTFVSRIGPEDAETLEKLYTPTFSGYDLINSDQFTWYVKLIIDNTQVKPFTMKTYAPVKSDIKLASAIKQLSRLKYGRDRAIVEAEILERSRIQTLTVPAPVSKPL
ncbi:MAG: type IV secretory system conjugative DNA transfer family protein [Patescibacteria group bacterium]